MLLRDLFVNKEFSEKYNAEGYVTFPLLDAAQVSYLQQVYDDTASQAHVDKQFFTSIWSENADYRHLVDSKIKEVFTPAIRHHVRDIQPVFANFMVKNTGDDTSLVPHQDWSFVEEPLFDSATIWCPLVDVDRRNGNLQVIPRSHLIDHYIRARFMNKPFDAIDPEQMSAMLIDIPMKAGEAIMLNSRLIHASPCNLSGVCRVATSLVIAPAQASLFHWAVDPREKTEIKKLAVTEDFFWQFSCYEYPDSMTPIETSRIELKELSLEEFHRVIEHRPSLLPEGV